MRCPFTGVVFAMELTHDMNGLLPLLVANVIAYGFTALLLKRSILTEKIARRGFHLSREYSVDPLEILFVREVMRTSLVAFPESQTLGELAASFHPDHSPRGQHLYPIIGDDAGVIGVVTRKDMRRLLAEDSRSNVRLGELARRQPAVAYPDESLRAVVYKMAESGFTRMPVVDSSFRRQTRRTGFPRRSTARANAQSDGRTAPRTRPANPSALSNPRRRPEGNTLGKNASTLICSRNR